VSAYDVEYDGRLSIDPPASEAQVAEFVHEYEGKEVCVVGERFFCQWAISDDGYELYIDDERGSCYGQPELLCHLIGGFFVPLELVVSGNVHWSGSDVADAGTIVVEDNEVDEVEGVIVGVAKCPRCGEVF